MKTLRILSGGATHGVVEKARAAFEAASGCTIDGTFSAVGAMRDRLLAGEPADECLVHSDWNFDWQRTYQYDAPIETLPTFGHGDTVELKCTYDNTMHNSFVQRALMEQGLVAPIDVVLGEQTLDEMCLALVGVIL